MHFFLQSSLHNFQDDDEELMELHFLYISASLLGIWGCDLQPPSSAWLFVIYLGMGYKVREL